MSKRNKFVNSGIVIPAWLASSLALLDEKSLCWFMRSTFEYVGVADNDTDFELNAPRDAYILYKTWYNWMADTSEEEYFNG